MSLPGVVFGRSEAFQSSSDTEYVDTSGVGSVFKTGGSRENQNHVKPFVSSAVGVEGIVRDQTLPLL